MDILPPALPDNLHNAGDTAEAAIVRREVFDAVDAVGRLFAEKAAENTSTSFTPQDLLRIAGRVAGLSGSPAFAATLQNRADNFPDEAGSFPAALQTYLDLTVTAPAQITDQHIAALSAAGLSADDIVFIAQWIAYITFRARLAAGLQLFEKTDANSATPSGSPPTPAVCAVAAHSFTYDILDWQPLLPVKPETELSSAEAAVLKKNGQAGSPYFLLLARHADILDLRTQIDKGIFYSNKGLPRWQREWAAVTVSKINGCVYCASVHARKSVQYEKNRKADMDALLATPAGEPPASGSDERLRALTSFSAALSATPVQASSAHIQDLKQQGFTSLEITDIILSTAFFSWANRLMLTLGNPVFPASEGTA